MYPETADPTIVVTICEEMNFTLYWPQTLEFACRYFPSRDTIVMSLIHHEAWLQHDRRLIWNTDETQLQI
jgi:hypothetical protein